MTPKLRNMTQRLHRNRGRPQQQKLWQAMRILRAFTIGELQAVTELGHRSSADQFVGRLRRAGFLTAQAGNHGRHEPSHYRLIRDTGPEAPWVIHGRTALYDPNTDTEHAL